MDPWHAAQERGAETDGPRRSEISAMMEKLAELNPTPNPAASAKLEGAPPPRPHEWHPFLLPQQHT